MAQRGKAEADLGEESMASTRDKTPRETGSDIDGTPKPPPRKCNLALTSPLRGRA